MGIEAVTVKPDPQHCTEFKADLVGTMADPVFHSDFVTALVLLESMAKGKVIDVQQPGIEQYIAAFADARDR